jgi:adenylate cyclase
MKNRLYSLLTGFVITLILSGFSFFYLDHLKKKQVFDEPNTYLDIFETMDQRFNDLKYGSLRPKEKENPGDKVVMIAVDDASLREVGRWPWNREIITSLLAKTLDNQVGALGIDIIFSEPEREAAYRDAHLGELIEKNSTKIVLGTYSDDVLKLRPYQDYCVTEAFLSTGGAELVKLNPSFVVDDIGDTFDDLPWNRVFKPLFQKVRIKSEADYLAQIKKTSTQELTLFQKNYLSAKMNKDLFDYCGRWLTSEDELLLNYRDSLITTYQELFNKKTRLAGLSFKKQLELFKKDVLELPVPQYGEWQGNTAPIQDPSLYTGSFVAHLDLDGYARRYPLFYRSGNRMGSSFIPSLALQTYLAATGYRADVKIEKLNGKKQIVSFTIKDPSVEPEKVVQEIPVDAEGRLIINYYGPTATLPQVSAKDLFSDEETITVLTRAPKGGQGQLVLEKSQVNKKEYFKNKAVILGVTAMAVYDLRNTPVAANYPGPEIHQTVLANLFNQQYFTRLAHEDVTLPLLLLALGLLLTVSLSFMGPLYSVIFMSAALAAFVWLDQFIFSTHHVLYSSIFFFLEIPLTTFSILVFKYASEEKKKNEIRKMFAKYVSPAVVDELLKNVDNLKLGGKKQDMSVFFSDVRGFTEFSEKMDPQALSQFLNEYLTPMTELVFNNKGTLDKYMGDGLMAFFGAPVAFSDHAYHACKCALQSLERLKILQEECARKNWPHIDIGIGINSGSMSVGNMGSKIVQSYTVIGDAVNLGSRLESANKEYGTKILISESTYSAVKDRFVLREVDLVRVKGKKEPIKAYELIAEKSDANMREWLEAYNKAYLHYQQQHFEVAKNQFSKIEKQYPFDTVARMYLKRCEQFIAEPPVSEWDGVYEMKAK